MFPYSSQSIRNTKPEKIITFQELVGLIRSHPYNDLIRFAQQMREDGRDADCRRFKQNNLPWLTPNALLKKRKIESEHDFQTNFQKGSGYIFFDVDSMDAGKSVMDYKNKLVQYLQNEVALISLSSSGRGISILVRINHLVTSTYQYKLIYDYIANEKLKGILLDNAVRSLGVGWFLPSDKDVFCNETNVIDVSHLSGLGSTDVFNSTSTNKIYQLNRAASGSTRNLPTFHSLESLDSTFVLETPVEFDGDFLLEPIPIVSLLNRPMRIFDNQKHKTFRFLLRKFLHLNPNASEIDAISFIRNINNTAAKPRMDDKHLRELVINFFRFLHRSNELTFTGETVTRIVHLKNRNLVSPQLRRKFANQARALFNAKEIVSSIGGFLGQSPHLTNLELAKLVDKSVSTIKRYRKLSLEEIDQGIFQLGLDIQGEIDRHKELRR